MFSNRFTSLHAMSYAASSSRSFSNNFLPFLLLFACFDKLFLFCFWPSPILILKIFLRNCFLMPILQGKLPRNLFFSTYLIPQILSLDPFNEVNVFFAPSFISFFQNIDEKLTSGFSTNLALPLVLLCFDQNISH